MIAPLCTRKRLQRSCEMNTDNSNLKPRFFLADRMTIRDNLSIAAATVPLLAPITRAGKREEHMNRLQLRRRNFLIGVAVIVFGTGSLGGSLRAEEVLKIGVLGV